MSRCNRTGAGCDADRTEFRHGQGGHPCRCRASAMSRRTSGVTARSTPTWIPAACRAVDATVPIAPLDPIGIQLPPIGAGEWAKCTGRAIRGCAVTWLSRCCPLGIWKDDRSHIQGVALGHSPLRGSHRRQRSGLEAHLHEHAHRQRRGSRVDGKTAVRAGHSLDGHRGRQDGASGRLSARLVEPACALEARF